MSSQVKCVFDFDKKYRTLQRIFNIVVRGLASQGWRRSQGYHGCAYRGEGGMACGVGHLLSNKVAKKADDGIVDSSGYAIRSLPGLIRNGLLAASPKTAEFLRRIQSIHDMKVEGDSMRDGFNSLAKEYGLKWPEDVAS